MPRERGGPIQMRMPVGGRFFDRIPETVGDIFDVEHLAESEWDFGEELTDEFLRQEEEKARALYESSSRALVAWPPVRVPQGYGGTYYWAMKMIQEPDYCLTYMMRAGEFVAEQFERYMQAAGDYVDVVIISAHDYGTQRREMFRPEHFRQFFVPSWQPSTEVIHRWPNAKTWIHCCGSVPHLLPHFVEAGVDCLNPVQWTAEGMDLAWMKETYGDQLVFWGGAVSTQRTLPFGTPEDVAREVTEVLDIMAPGGGYVVNPIHNILPEVPVENIVALYRTAQDYRYD
jgi:uroporphyrinogen-III decarboxylase